MSSSSGSISILFVDADRRSRERVATELEDRARIDSVTTVRSGEACLDHLETNFPDCVVTEYALPAMTGVDLLGAVRRRRPSLPVVLFPADSDESIVREALDAGGVEYVTRTDGQQYATLAARIERAVDMEGPTDGYRTAFEHATEAIAVLDPETREILDANRRFSTLLECSREHLVGLSIDEIVPDGSPSAERGRQLQDAREEPQDVEWEIETCRGTRLSVDAHLVGETAGGTERVFAFVLESDHTRPLTDGERRYRSLFEANPAVIWEADFSTAAAHMDSILEEVGVDDVKSYLDDNPAELDALLEKIEILDVSERAVERYGADSKADLMANLGRVFTEKTYEANREIWQRLAAGETHIRVPTVAETFDGERLHEIIEVTVPEPYADDLSRVYLTAIDVTDRKDYERKLTALHDVAAALETETSVTSTCERTIEASEAILEFDLSVIDLEEDGMLSTVAASAEMSPETTSQLSVDEGIAGKTYRTGESQLIEDVSAHDEAKPQGAFRSGISVPVGEHGVFQAVARDCGAFDRSDLELAELLIDHTESALDRLEHKRQLERQNERLEAFANIVSHDLRTPLGIASGHLELLAEDADFGDEHLATALDALDRMDALIDDLLALTMDGRDAMTVTTVDLPAIVEQCWADTETPGATLAVDTEQTVRADRDYLRQLLENLLANAIEHAPAPAEETVTVTVGPLADRDGFYIEDDGRGIPADDRGAIFDSGYTTDDDGTGYGLVVVEHVAETHDWTVDVTESTDSGARFEIAGVTVVE